MIYFMVVMYLACMVAYGASRQYRVKSQYNYDRSRIDTEEWQESPTLVDIFMILIWPVPLVMIFLKVLGEVLSEFVSWLFGKAGE